MYEPTLDAVVRRLVGLEREVRWWRLGIVAIVIVFLAGAAAPRAQEEVRASRFALVDRAGIERGELSVTRDDSTTFTLFDRERKRVLGLVLTSSGAGSITLTDNKRPRFAMGVALDGSALIGLADQNGQPRFGATASTTQPNGLRLNDGSGKSRAELIIAKDGAGTLGFLDMSGNAVWKAP